MDVNAFMEKYGKKEMDLREIELLSKRISNGLKESESGVTITLSRRETIFISKLLDKEIKILRLGGK